MKKWQKNSGIVEKSSNLKTGRKYIYFLHHKNAPLAWIFNFLISLVFNARNVWGSRNGLLTNIVLYSYGAWNFMQKLTQLPTRQQQDKRTRNSYFHMERRKVFFIVNLLRFQKVSRHRILSCCNFWCAPTRGWNFKISISSDSMKFKIVIKLFPINSIKLFRQQLETSKLSIFIHRSCWWKKNQVKTSQLSFVIRFLTPFCVPPISINSRPRAHSSLPLSPYFSLVCIYLFFNRVNRRRPNGFYLIYLLHVVIIE